MNPNEEVYLGLLKSVLDNGVVKDDRTGTGTFSTFGDQVRYDLRKGFPLLTTKKMAWKAIIHELIWFLNGDTNIQYLKDNGVKIWDQWAKEDGSIGPGYGAMWRNFPSWIHWREAQKDLDPEFGTIIQEPVGIEEALITNDQIQRLIMELRHTPDSRRLIVSAWNPALVPFQALPPCHSFFQVYTEEIPHDKRIEMYCKKYQSDFADYPDIIDRDLIMDKMCIPKRYLDLKLHQRSGDIFLGVPFNIASYSILMMLLANMNNMIPRFFIHSFGDLHIYSNHVDQVKEQLSRDPLPPPTVEICGFTDDLKNLVADSFILKDYQHLPAIKAPVAV